MWKNKPFEKPSQVDLINSGCFDNSPYPMHLVDVGDDLVEFARKNSEKELQEYLDSKEYKKL